MKKAGRSAVYAGSFDPLTVGHVWMIEQGASLFDELVVAIGDNPDKQYAFTLEDRLQMLRSSTKQFRNIKIDCFSNQFLISYAQSIGAHFILRGVRSQTDYEYERVMRNINGDLDQQITTIFLMPPRGIAEVSSSMVKGLIGPEGWEKIVKDYVPKAVFDRLVKNYHGQSKSK
ncbi:pantetheine-phosphate adenylyltransferase [Pedosphaera parvula]|uniref:Phosphopantetheine adenylyltransferase n=1 Tax=Pedosphaera parvula (strain Ellin514) TaxID=320771 RepID=B9X9Q9_PEDPL|nr:pantetheine-phosphate adenylyltransferase [Pedosphaera parvula]EEF63207.1 pantetheine-phosphate adenylyltransferase [Pedosphaera parvula Ellin514]